jgi:hypothetical protein
MKDEVIKVTVKRKKWGNIGIYLENGDSVEGMCCFDLRIHSCNHICIRIEKVCFRLLSSVTSILICFLFFLKGRKGR